MIPLYIILGLFNAVGLLANIERHDSVGAAFCGTGMVLAMMLIMSSRD